VPPVPKPKSKPKSTSKPEASKRSQRTLIIAVAAAVAAALIVGSLVLGRGSGGSSTTGTGTAVPLTGIAQQGTVLGNPKAKVELSQYEDLQCPICKEYMDAAFPAIVEEYVKTGKVRVDFRGMEFIGTDSDKALRIALAAGKQNKLWNVVDLFYREQGTENTGWVTDAKIDEILAQVPGLDIAKAKADAQNAEISKQIAAVQAEANARQVSGTPTFFVTIGKAVPYQLAPQNLTSDVFRQALDDALRG
jgi:protein-disulfide isomerase